MEIRSNSASNDGPFPIDLTKANRAAIREASPMPPKPSPVKSDDSASSDQKRVASARERFAAAASVHKRVHGARAEASENKRVHAARVEAAAGKRVHAARAEESEGNRVQDARARFKVAAPEDQVTLSTGAQELADTTVATHPAEVNDTARAQRVSELKARHDSGKLDLESLVAETAYRMLGGE